MRRIMVTGGAGFIGSNFINYYLKENPKDKIINVDKLTYAGNLDNLKDVKNNKNYFFEKVDISNPEKIISLFVKYNISDVIHFAAESHVDNSINGPGEFIKSNIVGTFVLLDAARNYWLKSPHVYKNEFINSRFHHISTDEVYGSLGDQGSFLETTPYAPNSPYSASKAGSDFIARSYHHTYGLNVTTTNCSNNYGPCQHSEKLIPTIIKNALSEVSIPIYGKGENIRDWLYVIDHCEGIELVFKKGLPGETYNIGGGYEVTNNEIVHYICKAIDKLIPRKNNKRYQELIEYVDDRPGHDWRYSIDSTKIKNTLGWKPKHSFEEGILQTIKWYL